MDLYETIEKYFKIFVIIGPVMVIAWWGIVFIAALLVIYILAKFAGLL